MSSVMFQGTASNVGKSIIAAALCRILTQDGYTTVPFKSQNMSLNSFIDQDGLEMGRAQVFQAEACNKTPQAYMNPILLKPCGNHISQIIVNGKSIGNMPSKEYQSFKVKLIPVLKDIFDALERENDVVVIEGAGSPAEININSVDISNMKMAEIANAPVILIADIDRGGVFASVVGTLQLLKSEERQRVKGVIINKFRGNKEYFNDGIKMLEDIINIPVLGLIPYFDIKIEDEDGVSNKFKRKTYESDKDFINIEIIKLEHMSNFTDFEVFEHIEKTSVRYVAKGENIGYLDNEGVHHMPDMLIIPGSKGTILDMKYIRESNLYQEIEDYVSKGGLLIGICGGYQILGNRIENYADNNSEISQIEGFGYIDMNTQFSEKKTTSQIEGVFGKEKGYFENLQGFKIKGYELHMGNKAEKNSNYKKIEEYIDDNSIKMDENNMSDLIEDKSLSKKLSKSNLKYDLIDGHILGTYCHGFFDNINFTVALINNIRNKKSLESISAGFDSMHDIKEKEYNKLANIVRENIDMDGLYKIIFEKQG